MGSPGAGNADRDGRERTPGLAILRCAARIVPRGTRLSWYREWEAETAYRWKRLVDLGAATRFAAWRLRARVATACIDALVERGRTMKMTGLGNELRFAARGLRRAPGFTAITVGTLALGIGAATAVFTLVDGVLLSPLPYDEPEQLIALQHATSDDPENRVGISDGLYFLYERSARSLGEVAAHQPGAVNLVTDGEPERVLVRNVTPSFFRVLGVPAALGRAFTDDEGEVGGPPVAILSDGLWATAFGRDPDVLGRTVDLNGTMHEIVGVMPPGFGHPDQEARLWLPLALDRTGALPFLFGRSGIARLSAGSTPATAQGELDELLKRLPEIFPDANLSPEVIAELDTRALVVPLKEALVGDVVPTLWILLGTVGFVLLIACANVANLLIVRADGRRREHALRMAIGASLVQLVRSSLGETVLIVTAGGLAGLAISGVALDASLALAPTDLPRAAEIGLDGRVLAFAASLVASFAFFFGLLPALRYRAPHLVADLRSGSGRGSTAARPRRRARATLVVIQVSLACILMVGSGLMLRSLRALRAVDPGFDARGTLTARITAPAAEVGGWDETTAFYREIRGRMASQPGVEAVGLAFYVPLAPGPKPSFSFQIEDHPRGPGEIPLVARHNFVDGRYFAAMGMELLEGRDFQDGDGADGARGVIVSRSLAERWWPDASPLGRRLRLGFPGEDWYDIIGVVSEARYVELSEPADGMVYWPMMVGPAASPQGQRAMEVVIETTADPLSMVPVLRRIVSELNPRIPVSSPQAMEDVLRRATARTSFTIALLGVASAVAMALGLVGIYGVISYVVSQRTKEIGVRMALGATSGSVRGMVLGEGLLLTSVAVCIGLIGAGGLSSVMAAVLFEVSPRDPVTYFGVAVALLLVSVVAVWIPATRAAGVPPSRALGEG